MKFNANPDHVIAPFGRVIGRGASRRPLQFILPLIVFSCTPLHAQTGFLAQQAQLAWQERDQPGQTLQAIELWRQAIQADPTRKDLWIPLTRAMGRAVRHGRVKLERQAWANQARAAGEEAVQEHPSSADAWAAYGEALGQWANTHKSFRSMRVVRQAIDVLEKAVALEPRHAYAHMLLAEFYRQAPRWVSKGDKEKALEHARLAVQYGPGYAINHLVLARACLDLDKKEEGVQHLQKILTLAPPPDAVPETRSDQETAREMLAKLGITVATHQEALTSNDSKTCDAASGYCAEQHP